MSSTQVRDRTAWGAFFLGGVLAGGNAVGVRFVVYELDALWGAGLRFALASALLAPVVAVLRLKLPRGRALAGALLYGLLNFAGAFGLGYYALTHLQAGLASTLLALVPLATLLLAVLQGEERLSLSALVGGVLALAGVAVLSNASVQGSLPLPAVLAGLGSVVCFGEAAVLIRRYPSAHPVTTNAIGMAVAAVVLVLGALLADDRLVLPQQRATWIALSYVVVVGSILVFMLYLVVLRRWVASRAVYFDLLIPPVAVVLSAWLDDEPITWGLLVGGLLIVAGVYVGALRSSATREL